MTEPVLTAQNGHDDIDNGLIVNGQINIRRTHPNLYLEVMGFAAVFILLAANFFVFTPTFQVWHLPNVVWGAAWLTLGVAKLVFLNVWRSLPAVRVTQAVAFAFILFFAAGTAEPWLDGQGSLQLPIMYLGMAALHVPMLLEPFLNPWTARRDSP